MTISFYNNNANKLAKLYCSKPAHDIHQAWVSMIPYDGGVALDIGAGAGRDADYLVSRRYEVIAVEPAEGLRSIAEKRYLNNKIQWLDDKLPGLKKVEAMAIKFDLILLSAVWMHVSPNQRGRVFRKLANLLKPAGLLVLTLRSGPYSADQHLFKTSDAEVLNLAMSQSLELMLDNPGGRDQLGRADVLWQTLVFQMPNDGTGGLPALRNIIVNDDKSSTYKLALLRSVIRIADAYPGMVLDRNEERVTLPMGLIALTWVQLFRPLVLSFGLPQNSDPNKGLGFVKQPFRDLKNLPHGYLDVGQTIEGDLAKSVRRALADAKNTICNYPAHYITDPYTNEPIFESDARNAPRDKSFSLDLEFLKQYGSFHIPRSIWDAMERYACWLEPAITEAWVGLMQKYDKNRGIVRDLSEYYAPMRWEKGRRNTQIAKTQVEQCINRGQSIHCVWTGDRIRKVDVDHCIPFSLWANNDLWNLLPSKPSANRSKGNRLPSAKALGNSKDLILEWWDMAYRESKYSDLFNAQAKTSLSISSGNALEPEILFDAMQIQRLRIKDFQQSREWEP
jgi:SAM-dependent methyltransferase